MPIFSYKVKTPEGYTRTARREAISESALVSSLRSEGMAVIAISKVRVRATGSGMNTPKWHPAWILPVTSLDVELALRQLASMLRSGVTMLVSLSTVSEQARRPRASAAWARVREIVSGGNALSEAMMAQKKIFRPDVVQLARVGEHSGELDISLERAAEQLESRRNLRIMVANALVYPCVATLMALAVSGYLVTVVIPQVAEFLQSGDVSLPAITQMLMDISDWIKSNGLILVIVVAAAVALWCFTRLFPTGRDFEDAFVLKIPVVGRILRLSGTASFARAMGLMTDSGVGLLDSLQVVSELLGNKRLSRRVEEIRLEVLQGESLASSLEQAPEFLPMLSRMTAVAEATGTLGPTFGEIARFHETMLTIAIKRFSVIMEPLTILITGGIVGFVYIAFFMALFSMASVT